MSTTIILIWNISITSKILSFCFFMVTFHPLSPALGNYWSVVYSYHFGFSRKSFKWNHVTVCFWLLSPSNIYLRFIHAVTWISNLIFLNFLIVFYYMYESQFVYLFTAGKHLGCSQFLASVNTADIHIPL